MPDFFRNTKPVNNIDPGALWLRQGDRLTLVDEDQYVFADFDQELFRAEPDENINVSTGNERNDWT